MTSPDAREITYAAKPIRLMVYARLVHVQSIVARYRIQMGLRDPCSLYLQAAISRGGSAPSSFVHFQAWCSDLFLTYLTQCSRWQMCFLKKWNSDFTGDDAEVGCVCSLEQLVKDALLLGGEIQVRVSLGCNSHNQSCSFTFSPRFLVPNSTRFTAETRISERRKEMGRGPEFGGPS